jgi:hypothetical protein
MQGEKIAYGLLSVQALVETFEIDKISIICVRENK